MSKTKCIIADDELLSLELLESYILRVEKLELVCKCKNGDEVFNALKTKRVDILFLDIQMPKLTGIELLKAIQHPPKIVFTTAFREFALDGYELNIFDYLLKPISFERFLKTIDKLNQPLNESVSHNILIQHDAFLYVKSDKKMFKVLFRDIQYIEGMKDYVKIKMTSGKDVITHQTLQEFEERLPISQFMRVHRSYIVALEKIKAYTINSLETPDKEIPIGKFYQKEVLKQITEGNP
jgi:DNA-binding LytR/AlgR family response regulator